MDDTDYALAYGFWGFVKGFGISATLPENNVYAAHWLREKAVTAGVNVESSVTDGRSYQQLFPWGVFLNSVPEWTSSPLTEDEMVLLMLGLREYTTKELCQLDSSVVEKGNIDFPRFREFVIEGLRRALPTGKFSRVNCEWAVSLLAVSLPRLAMPDHPFLALLTSALSAITLKLTVPDSWLETVDESVHRIVRTLRYRRSKLKLFLEHETAIQSFCEAKGWIKPIVVPGTN
jgi:hypothetical protein